MLLISNNRAELGGASSRMAIRPRAVVDYDTFLRKMAESGAFSS